MVAGERGKFTPTYASFPNNPAGFASSTTAMMMNTMVLASGG